MPNIHVPVFVWKDFSGNHTATPVDLELLPQPFCDRMRYDYAVSETAAEAVQRCQNAVHFYLDRVVRDNRELPEIEPSEPSIRFVQVAIRPQYFERERDYPVGEMIDLRLPMTIGKNRDGLLHCGFPTLNILFRCFENDDYEQIAAEKVRENFDRLDPESLLTHLAPLEVQLRTVTVKLRNRQRKETPLSIDYLEKVAQPLGATSFRKGFAAAWKREAEVARLAELLADEETNLAIVGPESVGRRTLLVAAVRTAERKKTSETKDDSPDEWRLMPRHRFWLTSASRLIAGAKYLGEWQEQVEDVIDDLSSFGGVLCLENLAELARLGGQASESIAGFLDSFVENGQLRLVGIATPQELDFLRRTMPNFADKFQIITVEPMSTNDARNALQAIADQAERDRTCTLQTEVVPAVIDFFQRFQPYNPLPGGPSRFLGNLIDYGAKQKNTSINLETATNRFTHQTGLPAWLLDHQQTVAYNQVLQELGSRVVGQDEACRHAAQLVINFKAAMNHPNRPIGSMLFCGPTGVGKTQLAKTLAEYLFGADRDESPLAGENSHKKNHHFFRLDMSEYATPWSATRLITREDGTPSELIQHVRRHPFSVILFDEIEKASLEVFDILLGLFDEGRLTDRLGRTAIFQSTIIIMTSNLGAASGPSIGFTGASHQSHRYQKAVRDYFRPEFFNRIDAILPFNPLEETTCRQIVRAELKRLETREGLASRRIRLHPTETLVDRLLQVGFDPRFGARPLQRTIESTVVSALAHHLASNLECNNFTLQLDCQEGKVQVASKPCDD